MKLPLPMYTFQHHSEILVLIFLTLYWGRKKKEKRKELKAHFLFPMWVLYTGNTKFSLCWSRSDWAFKSVCTHSVCDTSYDRGKNMCDRHWQWHQSMKWEKRFIFFSFYFAHLLITKFIQNFRNWSEGLAIRSQWRLRSLL